MKPLRWSTELTIVDIESGEILKQYAITSGKYYIESKTVKTTIHANTAIRHIQWNCRPNKQTEFQFG